MLPATAMDRTQLPIMMLYWCRTPQSPIFSFMLRASHRAPSSAASTSVPATTPASSGGSAKAGDLSDDDEQIMALYPDDFSDTNLPPGFDPPPAKPVYVKGSTQEQYKAYMVAKYEYETWENKLILYKIKVKKQQQEIKAKRGIQ